MNADELIRDAIETGQRQGIDALNPLQRAIFLVSELEVLCDKDGIDAFLNTYKASDLRAVAALLGAAGATTISEGLTRIADSLPSPQDAVMTQVSDLVSDRVGYDYDALARAVARQLANVPAS
jgi:hypothetical protein